MGAESYTVKEEKFPHVQYEEMRETSFNYLEIFTHKRLRIRSLHSFFAVMMHSLKPFPPPLLQNQYPPPPPGGWER
jgi:hypothetical protein